MVSRYIKYSKKVIVISIIIVAMLIILLIINDKRFSVNQISNEVKYANIGKKSNPLNIEELFGVWKSIYQKSYDRSIESEVYKTIFYKNGSYYFKEYDFEEEGYYEVIDDKIYFYKSPKKKDYDYYLFALIEGDRMEFTLLHYPKTIIFERVEDDK